MNLVYLTDSELAVLKNIVAEKITHNLDNLKYETEAKAYHWQWSNPDNEFPITAYKAFKVARNRQSKLKKHIAKLNAIQVSLKTPLGYPLKCNGYSI